MLILFGASINSHLWHTLLCATHMSILGVLPLFYTRGVDPRMWREIAGACLPFDEVWGALVGTVLGAWLGAVSLDCDGWGAVLGDADCLIGTYTSGLGSRLAKVASYDCDGCLCGMVRV